MILNSPTAWKMAWYFWIDQNILDGFKTVLRFWDDSKSSGQYQNYVMDYMMVSILLNINNHASNMLCCETTYCVLHREYFWNFYTKSFDFCAFAQYNCCVDVNACVDLFVNVDDVLKIDVDFEVGGAVLYRLEDSEPLKRIFLSYVKEVTCFFFLSWHAVVQKKPWHTLWRLFTRSIAKPWQSLLLKFPRDR